MAAELNLVFWFVGAYSVVVVTSVYTSLVASKGRGSQRK